MFCAFERLRALLVLVKLAAVSPDDLQELDHVLVAICLGVGVCALDLALEIQRALTQDEGVCALLVFFEEGLPLLCLGDVLLPQKHFSWVDGTAGRGWCWVCGIAIVGRLISLIAFAISGPHLYSFWMWFAIASTDF